MPFWRLTSCWVWLAENNTSAPLPAKSNQRKYFKRNGYTRNKEALLQFLSPEDCFWSLIAGGMMSVKVTTGNGDDLVVIFSIFVVFDNERTNWKDGNSSHPFSWQQRNILCPFHARIPNKEAASYQAAAAGLRAAHRRADKATPFNAAVRQLPGWWHLCAFKTFKFEN